MTDSTTSDDTGESARSRLVEERTRLQSVRDGLDDDHLSDQTEQDSLSELSSVDQHQADMGTETFEREKDISILEAIESELADVEHALRRLDEGTYGTCEACGRPIDDDRLQALPAARLCRDDQERAEVAPGATVTENE
ncbi:MAG TPA: TraR/DksA C4-type zinc finger protein [Acidimicrobiales bacterium]|jgi:RNA polymerase-binding transcription factor DksA|nr:TraR/DksA C4-type zinc finger protein [Acidimicrobiales bacterium]